MGFIYKYVPAAAVINSIVNFWSGHKWGNHRFSSQTGYPNFRRVNPLGKTYRHTVRPTEIS